MPGPDDQADPTWWSVMLLLLTASLLVQPTGPGTARVQTDAPTVYAEGCDARLDDGELRGQPGCAVRLAAVFADGHVERQVVVLPDARGWALSLQVGYERDLGSYGFTGSGVAAGVRFEHWGARLRWRRARARVRASALPELNTHVEEVLDLFSVGVTAGWPMGPLRIIGAAEIAYGRLQAETVQTDRAELVGATQPLWALVPGAGVELGEGPLRAHLEWSATIARGPIFPADAYGVASGDGPETHTSLLAHGPWLAVQLLW